MVQLPSTWTNIIPLELLEIFFLKSLNDSGSDIKTTIHIGDNPELDYSACEKIGLKAFLIDRDEKINGDYVINSLSSVLGKI